MLEVLRLWEYAEQTTLNKRVSIINKFQSNVNYNNQS
jgi:hypothetical protein